jgi:formylglycine-generating enzyme required for sulfatase activity/predicted ATPase
MSNTGDVKANNGSIAAAEISDSLIIIINESGCRLTKEQAQQLEVHYLKRMMQDCAGLEWLRLVRKQDENTVSLGLDAVYTALLTTHFVKDEKSPISDYGADIEPFSSEKPGKRLSALDVLNREKKLVLTGDPGGGKSAFVNYLALCMAGEHVSDERANLMVLTDPLPNDEGSPDTEEIEVDGKDESEQREVRQPWDQGALIPVRIILRDFSASDYFPDDENQPDVCQVMEFLHADLKARDCAEYYEVLKARLRSGEALVMFDGLDEVPQAGERRKHLLACIEGFARSYSDCRILVTCRPYAYQDRQWQLSDFAHTRLAEFGRGQMTRFIQRWYANSAEFDADTARLRAEKLLQVILSRNSLLELAKRPLLLSLIAYLHANRHELPERRADLYERLLELLVDEWEKARFKAEDVDAARKREQHSLAEFLQVGQDTIRLVLERLAFRAHALQNVQQQGTADIAAKDLIFELSSAAKEAGKKVDPWELCEYLRDRVGILYQRGGETEMDAIYTFPHRSFQEYLAAAYFRRDEDGLFDFFKATDLELDDEVWQVLAAHLGRTDPDRWREVIVLLGGIKAIKEPGPVWDFLDALMQGTEKTDRQAAHAWGLRLAAEILAEGLKRDNLNRKQQRILTAIQQALPAVLATDGLPVAERVAVGRYLAQIGDPRQEVKTVDAMRFCCIPAGPFFMGQGEHDRKNEDLLSETPAEEYDLNYDYWLAKYPVTVAQFQAFIDEKDFDVGNSNTLMAAPNTPVVYVSQREALDFCGWLTDRWRKSGWLSEGLRVTLPNEPEWEKAARGGLDIPVESSAADMAALSSNNFTYNNMQPNPEPQRRYPWGNEIDEECANYDMNVGWISTPGVYFRGASPYGCHDLSGNVWEWTRSKRDDYPYPGVGTAAWKQREGENPALCVLRGGAFDLNHSNVRCAVRIYSEPDYRDFNVGFRVVLSPLR